VPYVFIPVVVYIVFSKQWHIVAGMLPFAGSFIFLVIVLPWLLFISHRLNWDLALWKHEYFYRLFGDYGGSMSIFTAYLVITLAAIILFTIICLICLNISPPG